MSKRLSNKDRAWSKSLDNVLGNLSPEQDGDSSIPKLQASTNTFEPCFMHELTRQLYGVRTSDKSESRISSVIVSMLENRRCCSRPVKKV